jgi:hypothetical protein
LNSRRKRKSIFVSLTVLRFYLEVYHGLEANQVVAKAGLSEGLWNLGKIESRFLRFGNGRICLT